MNKADLIDALEEKLGSRQAANDAVNVVVDTIVRAVSKGERVAISGFGTFEKVQRAARTGRNPRTGETVRIKKTSVPRFKPGGAFKGFVAHPRTMPKTSPGDLPVTARVSGRSDTGSAPATKRATKKAAVKKAAPKKGAATAKGRKTSAPTKKAVAKKTVAKKTVARKATVGPKKAPAAGAGSKRSLAKRSLVSRVSGRKKR